MRVVDSVKEQSLLYLQVLQIDLIGKEHKKLQGKLKAS